MGIVREMIDAGLWLTALRLIAGNSPPKDLLRDLSDLPYASLGLPQYETERISKEYRSNAAFVARALVRAASRLISTPCP
jgi:hypothetical protein